MHCWSLLGIVVITIILASCADSPPQASLTPRIEGHIKSVSRNDIDTAIALAQRDTLKRLHHVLSVETFYVQNQNLIKVSLRGAGYITLVPVERVHGVWSITAEWVNV